MVSAAFSGRSAFALNEGFALESQRVSDNQSLFSFSLWITKNAYSPTWTGGPTYARFRVRVNGGSWVTVGEQSGSGFDGNGSGPWTILTGNTVLTHASDGEMDLQIEGYADFDILGTATVTRGVSVPTIPRASTPTTSAGTLTTGSAVTISTNRASGSFTHTLTYTCGGASGTIGTGIGASTSWTPPHSLASQFRNGTSGSVTLTLKTYSGSSLVGTKSINRTLNIAGSVTPNLNSLTLSDTNSAIASAIGAYVQGMSTLKGVISASGAYGSTIKSSSFTAQGVTANSGGSVPLAKSGTSTVTAAIKDSRGRSDSASQSITVLPYAKPAVTYLLARRSDGAGTLVDGGNFIRVDMKAAVQSLVVGGTQKNTSTIKAFTRPRGGTTWTARNVISGAALAYDGTFVISGGGNYPDTQSFDVKVEVSDNVTPAVTAAVTSIPTANVLMYWGTLGVGFGKVWEQGSIDSAGDIYQRGNKVIDTSITANDTRVGAIEIATQAEANAGTDYTRAITPQTLRNSQNVAWAMAAGIASPSNIAAGDTGTVTVTLPSGRFSQAPLITLTPRTGAPHLRMSGESARSTSSFTITQYNGTSGPSYASVNWIAIQMSSGSASG